MTLIASVLTVVIVFMGIWTLIATFYLKVTVHFLRFWLKTPFASTKFCDFYTEMVQGRQILMFYTTIVYIHVANDCGYKILRSWANLQKYQTLIPAKNSHLKV